MGESIAATMRVMKKVSALRATLEDEERMILDDVVEGDYAEVEGHLMRVSMTERAMRGAEGNQKIKPIGGGQGSDEVEAHKSKIGGGGWTHDEVAAHAFGPGSPEPDGTVDTTDSATGDDTVTLSFSIQYDDERQVYQVK